MAKPEALNAALWYRRFGPPTEVLSLEESSLLPLAAGLARIRMTAAAINPSDLIPMTGAYRHRVIPPRVAGYEGCGVIIEAATPGLVGRRALPLRGEGTWQSFVQADPERLILVPDDIADELAARAYINPLAAILMLQTWPVAGRRVLLTGGGSSCARLLGAWAVAAGASEVISVHRSPGHAESLAAIGVRPIAQDDLRLDSTASRSEIVFDAVGGPLADAILAAMPRDGDFVSYGLLSGGGPFRPRAGGPVLHRFHLRDRLEGVPDFTWRGWFDRLWPLLRASPLPGVRPFPLRDWREALAAFDEPGRTFKPILIFTSE